MDWKRTVVVVLVCAGLGCTPRLASTEKPAGLAPPEFQSAVMHPLDPLTREELVLVKELIRGQNGTAEDSVYSWIQLAEPEKKEVAQYKPGDPVRRRAFAVVLSPSERTSYAYLVDLSDRKVDSKKDLGNAQSFLTDWDYAAAFDIIDTSKEVRGALERRGFNLDGEIISKKFYLDAYAPGYDSTLTKDGRTIRAIRVLFADRQSARNDYGPYVEGLMVLVDLFEHRVLKIIDNPGPTVSTKAPHEIFDPKMYQTAAEAVPTSGGSIAALKQNGHQVSWHEWNFRYGFNPREGLVLYQVGYKDGGKIRPILYRGAVSEMLVPYIDPSPQWVWKEFFDVGEYGLGVLSSAARPGKELPPNAVTADVVFAEATTPEPKILPQRVFFFERDGGFLAQHTQFTDGSVLYGRSTELVVGFIATLGNYDYAYQWVFRRDGSFGFELELLGLILNKTVAAQECEACVRQAADGPGKYITTGDQAFGTLVSEQLVGVTHQHWVALRMDFDIDGERNAVKETNLVALAQDAQSNPLGRAFHLETTVFGREQEAARTLESGRGWTVYNPTTRSSLGHFPGYQVRPLTNAASCIPESRIKEPAGFTCRHLWVTRYNPDELFAAGWYPSQASPDTKDYLAEYSDNDENIYEEDDVLWYCLGNTHITKPEDFPIMPAGKVGVNFAPAGFFEKSPIFGHGRIELKDR